MRAMVSLLPGSRVDTAVLRRAHPIAEVVARYGVELRRQGRAMVGRCFFHTDTGRPNLYVYGDSESWRCYRCGMFNVSYEVLLQVLQRYFAHTGETDPQLA